MKRVAFLCVLAAGAAAAQADNFMDNARVQRVEPQYENVQVPHQECRSQWVTEQQPTTSAPSVVGVGIGAVVGGLLGNQVGQGHGKEAATAAGAVAGALVGNNMAGGSQPGVQTQQREVRTCQQVVEVQQRQTGFRVTYEYRGHEYVTVLKRDPGPTVPVQVSVVPVDADYHR